MNETVVAALIGASMSLLITVVTLITNSHIEKSKSEIENQQKFFEAKRDKLSEVYRKLISIINMFPKEAPNDVVKNIEGPPNYSMESFEAILMILNYRIEDYMNNLQNKNISIERRDDINTHILNLKYASKQITQIRDNYEKARDSYKEFYESDKAIFDLYAGQNVKNSLVEFEVVIHNVFISGRSVGDIYDFNNNIIERSRRILIENMREDIGII